MAEPRDLMARYVDGDASAFRELYGQVAPRLLGYLVKMAKSRPLAEDLLQQTFLKVHRARSAYIRGADPVPWIYAIAHRTFIDEARKQKRAVVDAGDPETLPDVAADPGETRADPEAVKEALDALAKLPEAQREAVVLTKLDGKSVAEAAQIAGTTVGAMKVRAHRGYEALRALLGARGAKETG
jgi:RNA polymerase sigma-70 factor, ECF subfamily